MLDDRPLNAKLDASALVAMRPAAIEPAYDLGFVAADSLTPRKARTADPARRVL